jgi:O-antigen/teichoic acid export membrane protein
MNYGLVLISPVILVRLLSIEEFGRYREFLLYAGVLGSVAQFGINSSLLRFLPDNPQSGLRFVNQAVLMTLVSSILVATGMLLLNHVFDGQLVGDYAAPLALYLLLYVNLDFWEFLWLAEKRSSAVLRYTTARLVARIVVVTASAALTRDVSAIISSLICLEAVRLTLSAIGWRARARVSQTSEPARWREQLHYCLPFGAALVLITLNKSLGSLFVTKWLGPVALAQYTIGTYLQPVISVLRNSLSDVVLPEMASLAREPHNKGLELWRRTTVMTAILLFAAGVLLARFADVLVVTLFSDAYRPAVRLFQVYLLVFVREAMDFGIPLRAINMTAPIMRGNLIAIMVNAVLILVLLPLWGALGAVFAVVIGRFLEGAYLAWQTARAYEISLASLAPWRDLLKVAACAVLASAVLYWRFWTERLGLFGVLAGGAIYMMSLALLLAGMRVPEASLGLQLLLSAPARVLRRRS